MFNQEKLKQVFARLDEVCRTIADANDREFSTHYVAERALTQRKDPASRRTGWSQFLHQKLEGKAALSADDVEKAFRGYRRAIHDLEDGVPGSLDKDAPASMQFHERVQEVENDILYEFGFAKTRDSGGKLTASLFRVSGYLPDNRTIALASNDPAAMRAHVEKIVAYARGLAPKVDRFRAICEMFGAESVDERPATADLSRVQILADSAVFDNTDWTHCDRNDIYNTPIQPCYVTRVIRIRVNDPSVRRIALEINTEGFGWFPLQSANDGARPCRLLVQPKARMSESQVYTRAFYQEFELSPVNKSNEVTITQSGVIFNGLQSQFHALGTAKEPTDMDWLGKRVVSNTQNADLTVILPLEPEISACRFVQRPENSKRDRIRKPDQRERIFESPIQMWGTTIEGLKAIWKLPPVSEPTIFSFQWSWR